MTEREAGGLTENQANAVYDILVRHAGAREDEDDRYEFVYHQTRRLMPEFRFMGGLGFGGKFWRNTDRRRDGSWGEVWYVSTYPELETPEREAMVKDANKALEALRNEDVG